MTLPMPTIPAERGDDIRGWSEAEHADLVLFMAGNQFMLMEPLIGAFRSQHPNVGNIYCQTLPPGLQLKQILAGGARFTGQIIRVQPDIYSSVSRDAMTQLQTAGRLEPDDCRLYLHNRIALMVPRGNPAGIKSVKDLGRDTVRISQPDPANEDIAHHIIAMYRDAGGEDLVQRIMDVKQRAGTTRLTVVHHRETPKRIIARQVDVGPVWATEIEHARSHNLPIDVVWPGADLDQRAHVNYYVSCLNNAPHAINARKFLDFIQSAKARDIYAAHGFLPHEQKS